jgi:hypothetical protein
MLHIFNLAYGMEQGCEIRKVGFPHLDDLAWIKTTSAIFTINKQSLYSWRKFNSS